MSICDDGHRPVVHDERNCPVCEAIVENKELCAALVTDEESHQKELKEALERIEELDSALRGDLKLNTVMELITHPKV